MRVVRLLATLMFVTVAYARSARADAQTASSPHHASAARHHAHAHPPSLSMGYANGGFLENGAHLDEDETIRYLPGRSLHYGTDELIGLLHRVARAVYRRHHEPITVGDLSASHGGPVGHHASHQSGRDADIAFFVVDRRGEQVALTDYVSFGRNGEPLLGGPLRYDTAKNWSLIEAVLSDPIVRVEHVFVSNAVRAHLLDYARAHGASASLVAHAEEVLHQPAHGSPHTNHFHVRIACPANDEACREGVRRPPHRHARHIANAERAPHEHHRAERAAHAPPPEPVAAPQPERAEADHAASDDDESHDAPTQGASAAP